MPSIEAGINEIPVYYSMVFAKFRFWLGLANIHSPDPKKESTSKTRDPKSDDMAHIFILFFEWGLVFEFDVGFGTEQYSCWPEKNKLPRANDNTA